MNAREIDQLLSRMGRTFAGHAVLLVDLEGRIVWLNAAAERIFGAGKHLVGQLLEVTFTDRDRGARVPEHELSIALRTGMANDDRWHVRTDGSQVWCSGALETIKNEADEPIAFAKIFRDRTDWKEKQRLLENEIAVLKHDREQHIAALGTLAHELRSPLSAVVNASAVLRHMAASNQAMVAPLGMLERQLAVIRRQVDDLVDVTRIATGKVKLTLAREVLQDVVQLVVATLIPSAEERQRRLKLVMPAPPIEVMGDSMRLQQIFTNLIGNALKFTPPSGEIIITVALVDESATVRVKDTGVGIPTDVLPRIFELFTQGDTKSRQQGLGIGLALVRELVFLHSGSVQVLSDGPGKGAEFIVRLPLANGSVDG